MLVLLVPSKWSHGEAALSCAMKPIKDNPSLIPIHSLYPQYFTILPTTEVYYQRAIHIQLVAPNILTSTDSVTVAVTVAVDATYASSNDHDPIGPLITALLCIHFGVIT